MDKLVVDQCTAQEAISVFAEQAVEGLMAELGIEDYDIDDENYNGVMAVKQAMLIHIADYVTLEVN